MRVTLLTIGAILCATLVAGATKKPQVVRFRPITREEYNQILKITDGKRKISEGRLITSGLAGLTVFKNLVTLTNTLWPNIWSIFQTPAEVADVAEEQTDSYPLCVLDSEQEESHHVDYEHSRAAPMDCIIVVRDNEQEEEEEEQYGEDYYNEPISSMMPDYQHWPFAPPAYPYLSMPYSPYSPYQTPFPYFSGFPGFPTQFPQQYGFGHGFPGGEQQQQQQQKIQSDYFNQPNIINPYYQMPFFPAPTPAPVQNNANSGPIVHVIRGDKRDLNQKRALKNQRRSSSTKPVKTTKMHEARTRRKVRIVPEEDGYVQVIAPKQHYRDNYSKVSLSRSAPNKTPVYIVSTNDLYDIT